MLNVALIGCGRISDLHALGYRGLEEARLHGVFDTDSERAEAKAREWGVPRVYGSFEEALDDPALHAVEILTPHHLHAEMAIAAAEAGKHISVQKPMALNLEEADRMIAAARRAGVVLRVYENFVYYPPYVKARQLIDAGEIGKPLSINIRFRGGYSPSAWEVPLDAWAWRFNPETAGGGPEMFDHGYHNYSLAMYLMGPVDSVMARIDATEVPGVPGIFVDAPGTVMWRHAAGEAGVMDVIYAPELLINETRHYADESRVEITGTRGVIFVNRCTGRLQNRPPVELYRDGRTTAFEDIPADWEASFIAATRDFVTAIREGRQPLLSGERGREVLEFALAVQQAAADRREIILSKKGRQGAGQGV